MKKKTAKNKPRDGFTDSDKHVLNGIKLYPWTADRAIAGQAMRLLYPQIGADGWDQYKRTKMYPGMLRDIIVCLWLCTQSPDEVDNADAAPEEAYKRAKAWATKRGIHKIDSVQFWQAAGKFADIMTEVDSAITIPKTNPDDDPPDPNE